MTMVLLFQHHFGNLIISWETAELTDIGVDFGLFGNRFSGTVNYYIKDTKGLLQSVPLSKQQDMVHKL